MYSSGSGRDGGRPQASPPHASYQQPSYQHQQFYNTGDSYLNGQYQQQTQQQQHTQRPTMMTSSSPSMARNASPLGYNSVNHHHSGTGTSSLSSITEFAPQLIHGGTTPYAGSYQTSSASSPPSLSSHPLCQPSNPSVPPRSIGPHNHNPTFVPSARSQHQSSNLPQPTTCTVFFDPESFSPRYSSTFFTITMLDLPQDPLSIPDLLWPIIHPKIAPVGSKKPTPKQAQPPSSTSASATSTATHASPLPSSSYQLTQAPTTMTAGSLISTITAPQNIVGAVPPARSPPGHGTYSTQGESVPHHGPAVLSPVAPFSMGTAPLGSVPSSLTTNQYPGLSHSLINASTLPFNQSTISSANPQPIYLGMKGISPTSPPGALTAALGTSPDLNGTSSSSSSASSGLAQSLNASSERQKQSPEGMTEDGGEVGGVPMKQGLGQQLLQRQQFQQQQSQSSQSECLQSELGTADHGHQRLNSENQVDGLSSSLSQEATITIPRGVVDALRAINRRVARLQTILLSSQQSALASAAASFAYVSALRRAQHNGRITEWTKVLSSSSPTVSLIDGARSPTSSDDPLSHLSTTSLASGYNRQQGNRSSTGQTTGPQSVTNYSKLRRPASGHPSTSVYGQHDETYYPSFAGTSLPNPSSSPPPTSSSSLSVSSSSSIHSSTSNSSNSTVPSIVFTNGTDMLSTLTAQVKPYTLELPSTHTLTSPSSSLIASTSIGASTSQMSAFGSATSPMGRTASSSPSSPTDDSDVYAVHTILVKCAGVEWTVYRRYSEFEALLDSLQRYELPGLPTLPPRTLRRNVDPQFLAQRQADLHMFLLALLRCPARMPERKAIRKFLNLDHPVPSPIPSTRGD